MYKLSKNLQSDINGVSFAQGNMLCIAPLVPDNTDYARFKDDILKGEAELQDSEGVVMSPDAAKEFVRTLP